MNKILYVASLGYTVNKEGVVYKPNGDKQVIHLNNGGYYYFNKQIEGKQHKIKVHRLQAYCLYGESVFEDGICVRHLNGNSKDNRAVNIAIGTHSDNMMDIPSTIRLEKALHATSYIRKYDYKAIKADRTKGMKYKELMEKYNISSKGTISHIINSKYEN